MQRMGFVVVFLVFCYLGIKKKTHPGPFANIFIRSGSFSLKAGGPLHSVCSEVGALTDRHLSTFFLLLTRISSLITRIKPSDHDRVALAAGTKLERIPDVIR